MNDKNKIIDNIIIGGKNIRIYINVAKKSLMHCPEITLRARGSHISDAATVAEILRGEGYHIDDIDIYTDDMEIDTKKGKALVPITAIEIRIKK